MSLHTSPALLNLADTAFPKFQIPPKAGIGFRTEHDADFASGNIDIPWLEIHSENFLLPQQGAVGSPRLKSLEKLREAYPISCHGVGLSLGSAEGLSNDHLKELKRLYDWIQPCFVSEHVSWSVTDGTYLNDLLPLPYTEEALCIICANIDHAQTYLGRSLSVENPSSYLSFAQSTMSECQFMGEIIKRTGCGLLLDVNNVFVSAHNHGFDPYHYIENLPLQQVTEIHIAGHIAEPLGTTETILIDTHSRPVCDSVWDLLDFTLTRTGPLPVLVEWDQDIPALATLLQEAAQAQKIIDASSQKRQKHAR